MADLAGSVHYPRDRAATFVNADIRTMALSLLSDADSIADHEPFAAARRATLLRASSKLLEAFAELGTLDGIRARTHVE